MQTPLNTIPLQQFIQKVKSANSSNSKDVKLSMKDATDLALSLGIVMSRLEGDLERLVIESNKSDNEIISIEVGKDSIWKW